MAETYRNSLTLLSSSERFMGWMTKRQRVLSQNLANVDTPDYRARDLTPIQFKETVQGSVYADAAQLNRTEGSHVNSRQFTGTGRPERQVDFFESTLSGNSVILEENLLKMNQTELQYQQVTTVYKKYFGFLNTSTGRSTGA